MLESVLSACCGFRLAFESEEKMEIKKTFNDKMATNMQKTMEKLVFRGEKCDREMLTIFDACV